MKTGKCIEFVLKYNWNVYKCEIQTYTHVELRENTDFYCFPVQIDISSICTLLFFVFIMEYSVIIIKCLVSVGVKYHLRTEILTKNCILAQEIH